MTGSLVAIIGPPGAGKTTAVTALAGEAGVPVFRLRDAVAAYADAIGDLRPSVDSLGWVSVEAVRRVLHEAFVQDGFASGTAAVLLENFPGTAEQLTLLIDVAATLDKQVAVLELLADDSTVTARVGTRRVCLECGPDRHHPAVRGDSSRCGPCQGPLSVRDSDAPLRHAARLRRYRTNLPALRAEITARNLPHATVAADLSPDRVLTAVWSAYHRFNDGAGFPSTLCRSNP